MNIRVRFSKYGFLKFIGHLDVMRYFQKAIRRADIDILYSEGYSPHQIMSFASPLGLGITSEGEYMDIAVGQTDSSAESIRRLNAQMAEGIEILSYRQLPEKSTNAMASVAAADYVVDFREEYRPEGDWQQDFLAFCGNPAILYEKETKKGSREIDLRPHIHRLSEQDDKIILRLTAGSVENIKPEFLMDAFFKSQGKELSPYALQLHRLDLLANDETDENLPPRFRSLEDYGTDIL